MVKDNILHAQYTYWCEVLLALRRVGSDRYVNDIRRDPLVAVNSIRPDKTLRIMIGERHSHVRSRYDDRLRNAAGLQYCMIRFSLVTSKGFVSFELFAILFHAF